MWWHFQEIAQSGKQRFVVCYLTTADVANYYKLVPLYGYYNTFENGDFNTRTIHKKDFNKIPHKEFSIINERYKAEGFCITMNERLKMLNSVETDHQNCWATAGGHTFWYDGKVWHESDKPFISEQYTRSKQEILHLLMTYDWEYNPEIVKLCNVNSFKRIINKLFK